MRIHRFIVLAAIVSSAWMAMPASAQTEIPKVEVFGGYSRGLVDAGLFIPGRDAAQGWGASVTANFNRWLGLTADISGEYGHAHASLDGSGPERNFNARYFLFGPRLHFRRESSSLFGHALFGVARTRVDAFTDSSTAVTDPRRTSTNFAMGYGGAWISAFMNG